MKGLFTNVITDRVIRRRLKETKAYRYESMMWRVHEMAKVSVWRKRQSAKHSWSLT